MSQRATERATGETNPPKVPLAKRDSVRSNISVQSEKFVRHNLYDFEKDYQVVTKLGEGSFGQIFKVKHKELGLERALKILSKKNKVNQPIPKHQINALIKLDHPNIIKIYEFYQSKDFYYIVMQLFDGKQLYDQLVIEDYFTEAKAARVSLDILKAIHYMHQQNIIHRDMKAENIMIRTEGEKSWIKLIDFGLGVNYANQKLKDKIGTPEYIAPEVLDGKYDEKCDLWGFGVILHTMLGGEMPFLGDSQQEVFEAVKKKKIVFESEYWGNVSEEGKNLVSRLLERNPKKRLNAEEALRHPWFKKLLSSQLKPIELKSTLNRLKQLQLQNHLHTAAHSYINNHMSSMEQKRKLDQIFSFLDTNHNGVLQFSQLHSGYKTIYGDSIGHMIAEEVFAKLDYNHSGTIEYNEFITYAMLKHKEIPLAHLEETFKLFDTNKDGMISTEELKRILSNGIEDVGEEEWGEIIRAVDQNEDGEISKEEFFSCMNKVSEICISTISKNKQGQKVRPKVKKTSSNSTVETRRSLRLRTDSDLKPTVLENIPEVIEIQASFELKKLI